MSSKSEQIESIDTTTYTVYLDVDGVLTDFVNKMCYMLNCKNPYKDGSCTQHNFCKFLAELYDDPFIVNLFYEIMDNEEFWFHMELTQSGRILVDYLRNKEIRFCLATRAFSQAAAIGKLRWMRHWSFHDGIILLGTVPKKNKPDVILIDDSEHENPDILVPKPWNRLRNFYNNGEGEARYIIATLEHILAKRKVLKIGQQH